MKICSKCGIKKELTEFYKDNNKDDKLTCQCKGCLTSYRNINKERYKLQNKLLRDSNKERYRIYNYKNSAKTRNLIISITDEEIINICKESCHFCGKEGLNGIDRKDNTKGYILDNCLPCCKICNYMKKDSTYDEFVQHIKNIFLHLDK